MSDYFDISELVRRQVRREADQLDQYVLNAADALGLTLAEMIERYELVEQRGSEPVEGSGIRRLTSTWRLRHRPTTARRVSAEISSDRWGYVVRVVGQHSAVSFSVGAL